MKNPGGSYLTAQQLADRLNVSLRSVFRRAQEHPEWTLRFGTSLRFNWPRIKRDLGIGEDDEFSN